MVDGLGGGREVGRLEFPKKIGFKDCREKNKKRKVRLGRKNRESKEKKKHEGKKNLE